MGPCPFRHGYAAEGAVRIVRADGFNGAMPFQAWIFDSAMSCHSSRIRLQWGHALSGMDMRVMRLILPVILLLQWGHALSGMDIFGCGHTVRACFMLQWGHALSGMDMGPVLLAKEKWRGFNGAMPFQAWI